MRRLGLLISCAGLFTIAKLLDDNHRLRRDLAALKARDAAARQAEDARDADKWDTVDEAGDESFLASDPPAFVARGMA